MARFLRDMPEGCRSHARASAPTVEESPGKLDDRGLEDGQQERRKQEGGQQEKQELDTVERKMARLFREPEELMWDDDSSAMVDRVLSAVSPVLPVRGRTLGRYLLFGELGSGGMGMVLKAYDESLDRAVAIKLLHSEAAERHTERLRREAQALAKLSHPNVVQVYEVGQQGEQWFIAMELVRGQTLREWQQTPRGWRECVEIYLQAGAGLVAAHRAGLVHRDFKPDNCIVDKAGRPRVLDFGLVGGDAELALDVTSEEIEAIGLGGGALELSLTESGTVLGTPAYMPPEQMRGEGADARSDQFSFCVSLYEAIYGERPFEGVTMPRLLEAVSLGAVRSAPKGASVPGSLRQILLRGLAAEPMRRWPSMDELLTELRRLVAPRRWRWLALSASMVVGLGLIGVGQAYQADMGQRCTGARDQMDGIWDDARRQEVEAAILGTKVSYAPDTWQRVEQRFDAYTNAWMDKHTKVCEATSVRGEQSDLAMDLRMRCLHKRRSSLRASVDVLADADAEVVENAVTLVAGLPILTRCDDLRWLEQQAQRMPLPEDPDVATEVEVLRERLADIAAMHEAGRYAEALEKVESVLQRGEALGYTPLLAEAQYRRGVLRDANGQYAEAERDLRQAHSRAVEHHHDAVALHTAQSLTYLVGYQLARHTEGQQWGQAVALPLAHRSGEPVEVATSLANLGVVFASQGDYENAWVHQEHDLAIKERALGPDHPNVATSLTNLGNMFVYQGDYENARIHHQRALAVQENALGVSHPYVATSLSNLGLVFFRQGDMANARVYHQRALAINEKAFGPNHPSVALSLNALGFFLNHQGDVESAKAYLQRALVIQEKALGPNHPDVAASLSNLGNVFTSQGDYENAQEHHERALAIKEKALGLEHPYVAKSLSNLGSVHLRRGDYEEAKRYCERALAIWENALGSEHPDVALSLVGLAMVALKMGDSETARENGERAVSIRKDTMVAPQLLAEARFVLAQALWSEKHERPRAHVLAVQARDALATAEDPGESDLDLEEIDAWLVTHRVK
ncbi:MAG: tetratricopeptide repeat protein [Myxococcota bacterium]